MKRDRVIIVHLRRPRSKSENPEEMRSDPFWEFGSFGITTCHGKNLMHPRHAETLKGAQFAFAQGGKQGTRLVYLTAPVTIRKHNKCIEARWFPKGMPFRYSDAPILVSNTNKSDFPVLEAALMDRKSSKIEGEFGSRFRSRAEPLDTNLAREIIRVYKRMRRRASESGAIARCYADALPWLPPKVDDHRKKTYSEKLKAADETKAKSACAGRKRSTCVAGSIRAQTSI